MRRPHKVTLMLSAEELARLRALSRRTGLSQSSLLRSVVHVDVDVSDTGTEARATLRAARVNGRGVRVKS